MQMVKNHASTAINYSNNKYMRVWKMKNQRR